MIERELRRPGPPASGVEPLFTPPGGASFTEADVRQAERRMGMPQSKLSPERTVSDLPASDRREAEDQAQELSLAGGPLPAPAGRFGITDPQRWLDLCG